MKESLYGWYPPAKGQWKTHNQDVSSYDKECLYKFTQSKFVDDEGVRTPTPQSVKIRFASRAETIKTPIHWRTLASGRSSVERKSPASGNTSGVPPAGTTPRSDEQGQPQDTARSSQIGDTARSSGTPALAINSNRPQSAISYQGKTGRPGNLESDVISAGKNSRPPSCFSVGSDRRPPPGPKRAWPTRTEATPVTIYDASGNPTNLQSTFPYLPIPRPDLEDLELFEARSQANKISQSNVPSPVPSGGSRRRAQSATIRRETPATPPRPVQSARPYGENRPQSSLTPQTPSPGSPGSSGRPPSAASFRSNVSGRSSAKPTRPGSHQTLSSRPLSQCSKTSQRSQSASEDYKAYRPNTPHPPQKFGASPPNGTRQERSPVPSATLDYDTEFKKHGWRMEIPGDPLNLKRPCLHPRNSYVVNVHHERTVAPNPPKGHMENYTTFFSNTIPRNSRSFTIHPEMISEVLHAKRMQLQKRDGMIYQTKNYAFLY